MARDLLTDEMVEEEIRRLNDSEAVQLALREQKIKYRRRQKMYQLRWMEKRGQKMMAEGITLDNIEEKMFEDWED